MLSLVVLKITPRSSTVTIHVRIHLCVFVVCSTLEGRALKDAVVYRSKD